MNNRIINTALVIVAITVLGLLAFRVNFERLSDSGCCGMKESNQVNKGR
jgi:hypothetical protein